MTPPYFDAANFLRRQSFMLHETGPRLARYAAALAATVRPGAVVLDLGSGSGILSLLACRAGAQRVYAIEAHPMAPVAQALATANGFADRIVLVPGFSIDVSLPEPVDVLVTDTWGCCGLQPGGLRSLADAVARFLAPGGRVIPARITLHAAPVEAPGRYAENVACWEQPCAGVDVSPLRALAVHNWYPTDTDGRGHLGAPVPLDTVETGRIERCWFDAPVEVEIARAGVLHGIEVWFTAALADGISIGNDPADNSTGYRRGFFPLPAPIPVAPGDRLTAVITGHDATHWRWRGTVTTAESGRELGRFDQSTFWGEAVRPELAAAEAGLA